MSTCPTSKQLHSLTVVQYPQCLECAQYFPESATLVRARATLPSQGMVHRGSFPNLIYEEPRRRQLNWWGMHLIPIVQKKVIRDLIGVAYAWSLWLEGFAARVHTCMPFNTPVRMCYAQAQRLKSTATKGKGKKVKYIYILTAPLQCSTCCTCWSNRQ